MSDYIPITQELRDDVVTDASIEAHCDKIDALYKSLEKQNEELRKELKKRPIAGDAEVIAFVERLRDAAEKHEDVTLWGVDYTALPLDADGVPIHVGEVMDTNCFGTVEVEGFIHSAIAFYNYEDQQARLCTSPAKLCHHHKPTVMDVLDELLMNWPDCEGPEDELALKQRCAERLRLADGDAE